MTILTKQKIQGTKYSDGIIDLHFRTYTNGRISIEGVSLNNESMFRATVNIPEVDVPESHVLLKGWEENQGIPEALMQLGVVGPVLENIPTGYCVATLHKLLKVGD